MSIGKVLSEYESNGLPKLPPGFMGTHFIRTDDRIHKILTLESSWKGKKSGLVNDNLVLKTKLLILTILRTRVEQIAVWDRPKKMV